MFLWVDADEQGKGEVILDDVAGVAVMGVSTSAGVEAEDEGRDAELSDAASPLAEWFKL